MNLEQAESLLDYENVKDYIKITNPEQYGSSRWEGFYEQVYQNADNGEYWKITWSRGLTELQDGGPHNIEVKEVHPTTKTIMVYE